MLDEKDLQAIGQVIKKNMEGFGERVYQKLAESETKLLAEMDRRFADMERRFDQKLDERIIKSETMLLSEMERIHSQTQKDIARLEKKVDDMCQLQRAYRLENEAFQIVMSKVELLDERVEKLENTVY